MSLTSPLRSRTGLALALALPLAMPALAETKLTAVDGAADDQFGYSVAISGSTAIVGAYRDDDKGGDSGAAYLFDTTTGARIAKLVAYDGAADDRFGASVAIHGGTVIVGTYLDDDRGPDSGSAYLLSATGTSRIAKLIAGDGAREDYFGAAVGISGTAAIVGAYGDDDKGLSSGSAYLFDTTTGRQIRKLTASDGAEDDAFGRAVAISGTTAIVGARGDDDKGTNSGSAYLFDITTGAQIAKLTASDGTASDQFGTSVAIHGNTAIVGAIGDADNGSLTGSAYLFDTTTGAQIAKLTASDGAGLDIFGRSVAIYGTIAIVGADRDDDRARDSGAAYLFDITTGREIIKLTASDGAARDYFGWAVGIDEDKAIVGAYQDDDRGFQSGSAYIHDLPATVVPLPAGLWLLGGALGALALRRRRKAST